MRTALKIGFSFGLTSGVITTLGLMVGLHAGTHSKSVVLGGLLTIAVADGIGTTTRQKLIRSSDCSSKGANIRGGVSTHTLVA